MAWRMAVRAIKTRLRKLLEIFLFFLEGGGWVVGYISGGGFP